MKSFPKLALAAAAALSIAAPAFAATTTIKVNEGGEGGQPMTLTLDKTT